MAAELPPFKSGFSMKAEMEVDSEELFDKADAIYDVVEHDDEHMVWRFSETTDDWAFVDYNGLLVVASTEEFDLARKGVLMKEFWEIVSTIRVSGGNVSKLWQSYYYTEETKVYRAIRHELDSDFSYLLMMPNCTVYDAQLSVSGEDRSWQYYGGNLEPPGQHYFIDDEEVCGCDLIYGYPNHPRGVSCGSYYDHFEAESWVEVVPVDIKTAIQMPGLHTITSSGIDNEHELSIYVVSSPTEKPIVLYNQYKTIWEEDQRESLPVSVLYEKVNLTTPWKIDQSSTGEIIGIDASQFPIVRINVFIDDPYAIGGNLSIRDFSIKEDGQDIQIDKFYFTGTAIGQKLDLVIAFDTSESMADEREAMEQKVQQMVEQIEQAGLDARYSIVEFSEVAKEGSVWTRAHQVLKNSINNISLSGGFPGAPENAIEAIERAIALDFRPDAWKAAIVITDEPSHQKGDGSNACNYTKEEVVSDLKDRGVTLIAVSPDFSDPNVNPNVSREKLQAYADMKDMALDANGLWIDINSADFSAILDDITSVITGTYVIEYKSPDPTPGTNRTVFVTVDNPNCQGKSDSVSYVSPA
ncbi:MAG: VWA domain-containing protein [Methanosarcinales archaeon]|nr:VWA domain-containing protein [Methanosarcinales archaeon]